MAWDVNNPKGRIASISSTILWSMFIVFLIIKGDWTIFPILLFVLFTLLLVLSIIRIIQEWKEGGVWLE